MEDGVEAVAVEQRPAPEDWLVKPPTTRATVQVLPARATKAQVMLTNGLIGRTF